LIDATSGEPRIHPLLSLPAVRYDVDSGQEFG